MLYEIKQDDEINRQVQSIASRVNEEIDGSCLVAGVNYPLMFFAMVKMMEVGEEVKMRMKKTTKDRIDFYTL